MRRHLAVRLLLPLAALGLAALPAAVPAAATEQTPAAAAAGPIDVGGSPVEPSTDTNAPTSLEPGLWSDVLGAGQTALGTHQFAYQRRMADSTVHFAVTASPEDSSGDGLELIVETPDGETCGTDSDTVGSPVPQALLGVGLTVGPADPIDRNDECVRASELRFSVGRFTTSSAQDLSIAVRVVEEAPIVGDVSDLATTPTDSPLLDLPRPASERREVAGAVSFDDAPTLTSEATYDDLIQQGDVVLYRIRLGWGQALTARIDVPVQDAEAREQLEFSSPAVALTLLDAQHAEVSGQVEDDETLAYYDDEEPGRLADGTAPVAYLNRFDRVAATVPGDYWISLAVQPAAEGEEPLDVPVQVTVAVRGDEVSPPTYAPTVIGPDGTVGPEAYDARTPYLVGPETFAADVSGAPSEAVAESGADRDLVRLLGGLGLGVVSLISLVVGTRLLRRRSRATQLS